MTRTVNIFSSARPAQARPNAQPSASSNPEHSFDDALTAAQSSNQKPATSSATARQDSDRPSTSATSLSNKDAKTSNDHETGDGASPKATADGAAVEKSSATPTAENIDSPKAKKSDGNNKTDVALPALAEISLQAAAATPVAQVPIAQPKPAVAIAASPALNKAVPIAADAPPSPVEPPPKLAAEKHAKAVDPHLPAKTPSAAAPTAAKTASPDAETRAVAPADAMAAVASAVLPAASSAKTSASGKSNSANVAQTSDGSPNAAQSPSVAATLVASAIGQSDDSAKGAARVSAASTADDKSESAPSPTISVTTASSAPRLSTSTDRASSASPAQGSPASDPASAFDQIVLGLRGKIDAHNGKAEIRLNPPNLGTVRISVNLDHGNLTAQFQSSSDVVRELLKSNMEKLKTVLESQGVTVDKLAVESSAAKPTTVNFPANYSSANAAANDGRSAGQYQQSASDQKRSPKEPGTFSRIWNDATADSAPIDLVA